MSNHEVTPSSESISAGLDSASGLPGNKSNFDQDIFGQPLSKPPLAMGRQEHPLLQPEDGNGNGTQIDSLTGLPAQNKATGGHGYEFESGIPPIDYTVHLAGKALDAVDRAVESHTPIIKQTISDAATQISETIHDSVDAAQKSWNAPDNQTRNALTQRFNQVIGFAKQRLGELSDDPDVKEAVKVANRLSHTLAEKTKNFVETAQSTTETWVDRAFDSSYVDESLTSQSATSGPTLPFVGVIDTGFKPQSHGAQVVDVIQQSAQRFPDWLGDGVGKGGWDESLVKFVDAAKASGRAGAIANLSFDLAQLNSDGTVSTRTELTAAERDALQYAQEHGILIVAAAGNQGGTMSALGQAAQEFDNIITVGASENGQRAAYSSYGQGLGLVADGDGKGSVEGTSISAARVTAAAVEVWQSNPNLHYRQIIQALESTATDLEQSGRDFETGMGQVNSSAAVEKAGETISNPNLLPNQLLHQENDRITSPHFNNELNAAVAIERPAFLEPANLAQTIELLKYEEGMPLMSSQAVESWQAFLKEQGYSVQVDGVFGPRTADMTRHFQTAKGITDDGIVGPSTLAAAEADGFTPTDYTEALSGSSSSAGSSGVLLKYDPNVPPIHNPTVEQWQQQMNDRGWNIAVDGLYGAQSAAIASQFQQEKGLAVDGIVGPQTWAATFDATNLRDLTQASFELVSFQNNSCAGSQSPAAGGRIERRIQEEFEKQYPDATYEVTVPNGSEVVKSYDENRNPIHADGRADIVLNEDSRNEIYEIKPNDTPGRYQSQIDRYVEQGQLHCNGEWTHGDNQFVELIDMGNEELLVFTDHQNYPGLILYDRREKDSPSPRVPTSPQREQQEQQEEERSPEKPSAWERAKAGASQFAEDVKELPGDFWDALTEEGSSDGKPTLPDTR